MLLDDKGMFYFVFKSFFSRLIGDCRIGKQLGMVHIPSRSEGCEFESRSHHQIRVAEIKSLFCLSKMIAAMPWKPEQFFKVKNI